MTIELTTAVKELLELADLDETYFADQIRDLPRQEMTDRPGFYQVQCLLAQSSPFDPETGTWRRVEAFLRKKGSVWEVYDVQGLKLHHRGPR
jgi:hypothetical protein